MTSEGTVPATAGGDVGLSTVLDCVTYPIALLGRDGRVAHLNVAGQRLLGRGLAEVVGRDAAETLPEFCGAEFARYRRETAMAEPRQFEEYHAGRDLWTDVRVCPSPAG